MKLLILLQCCVLLCKLAAGHEGEGCREGLGMENGNIDDNQITASSERPFYKAVNARLRYKNQQGRPFGWQPKNSRYTEWLQVDLLLDNYTVTGVATQGCLANRKTKLVFSVTKYQLEYSNDGKVFSANHKLYKGNTDECTVVYHTLETPVKARYIRFQPKSWKNKICMRVELYGYIAKACDSSPCLNGGTCFQDESGEKYNCKCTSGWKGDNCEQKFTACDSSPCLNGGTCFQDKNGFEEYICKCTNGWKGDNCNETIFAGLEDSVIVGNNTNYLRNLTNWLSPVLTCVHFSWKLCWRASVDGWAASTFHSRCDGKGPTVTIIRVGKYIFGGYTSVSWNSLGRYEYDSKAFLFSLVNKPGWAPIQLLQTGIHRPSKEHSIYCQSNFGPSFGGAHDIHISDYASSNSYSYSKLGSTYNPPRGYIYSSTFLHTFLAGTGSFTPDEVETFCETNKK